MPRGPSSPCMRGRARRSSGASRPTSGRRRRRAIASAFSRRKRTSRRWRPRSRRALLRDGLRRFHTDLRNDLERSGRELYASIRALDATGVDKIFAIGVGSEGLARAIHDRLMRAADGRTLAGRRSFKSENPTSLQRITLCWLVLSCAANWATEGKTRAAEGAESTDLGRWLYESREHGGSSGRSAGSFTT